MDVTRAGKGEPGLQNPAGPTDKTANLHALESVLPKAVKRRVHALKRLQVQCVNIEAKFYEEVHLLERKYADLCRPIYDKRRDIVTAAVEPTDAECEWTSDKDEEDELSDQIKKMIAIDTKMEDSPSVEDPKGIPDFWLTIFRNADMLTDMIQEHDEPILKHLKDVQVKFSEAGKPMSFTLEFYFEPNCYFNNAVLTKVYKMKFEPDTSEPFSFEGPEIVDCVGCMIDWHKGKDVTVKTIKKKQKHKGRGTVRTVTKQVPNPSFFNFFNPVKGGGWQDQVGGLEGGIKVGRSEARLPLRVRVERPAVPDGFLRALERHLLLVYTGKTRLARNLLQAVVRRWYSRLPAMVRDVGELVANGEDCARACRDGCLSAVGICLDRSWLHKKCMAPGCEPTTVRAIMEALRPLALGQSLAGAGGGGFLCLLSRLPDQKDAVACVLADAPGVGDFTVHTVEIDTEGLALLQPV